MVLINYETKPQKFGSLSRLKCWVNNRTIAGRIKIDVKMRSILFSKNKHMPVSLKNNSNNVLFVIGKHLNVIFNHSCEVRKWSITQDCLVLPRNWFNKIPKTIWFSLEMIQETVFIDTMRSMRYLIYLKQICQKILFKNINVFWRELLLLQSLTTVGRIKQRI